jgi:DNA-binding beta-propeller fold protein YncE
MALVALLVPLLFAASAEAHRNVYVTGSGSTDVSAFDIGPLGALTELASSPYTVGNFPEAVAIAPDGAHLYVANSGSDISGFSISQTTGALTALPGSPFSITPFSAVMGLAFSPDGAHLYATATATSKVHAFNVAASGALTELAGSPYSTGAFPEGVAVRPDGANLYVANLGDDNVSGYAIAANGSLSPLASPTTTAGDGPRGVAFTPDGEQLYVANIVSDNVSAYAVGPGGALTPIAGSPFLAGDGRGITVAPDGDQLYVPNASSDQVSAFDISAPPHGLIAVTGSPFAVTDDPASIAMTPGGGLLYVADNFSDDVRGFGVAANGSLTQLPSSPYLAGDGPDFQAIAITPDQPPVASFTVAGASTSLTRSFDAGASLDPDSSIARYDWDFGDGKTLVNGGPTPTHNYKAVGSYTAHLLVTDEIGCSLASTRSFTGQSAYCNGGPEATTTRPVTIASPPGPPDPPDPTPDTSVEGAALSAKKKQKQKGRKVVVKLEAGAGEDVSVRAKGNVKAGKKSYSLRPVTKSVAGDASATFKLEPKKSKSRKAIAKALERGEKAKSSLTATFTDGAGNTETRKLSVKLK